MHKLIQVFSVLIFTTVVFNASAQQSAPVTTGSVKGLLQDTAHNYTVKSATVSVYRADSTLLNYQLSNNYGEFSFSKLPINNKYYIEVSHVSYQRLRKSFSLTSDQPSIDLKTLILSPRDIELGEVVVGVPPIQMNGDTLEFNAAAFKLDTNAVVEDLLRVIPNVTLWGDGQITVNGREVKSLLVNGKEFFGGDFKMATQNISKNALQKVQVYNVQTDEKNPLDSTLTVNLKLKKGKDTGHFGKVGGGYGTTERFEADGNINFFAPKLQLGIITAGNNVNKIANDIRTLTSNSTFKGPGLNVEYQPNFRTGGMNRTSTGGATFSYNFIEKPTYQDKKTLTANYFVQHRDNDVIADRKTTTSIGQGRTIIDNSANNNSTLSTNQNFDSRYDYANRNQRLNISQNLSLNTGENSNRSLRTSTNGQNELASTNNTAGQNRYNNRSFGLNANYDYNNYTNYNKKIRSFNLSYSLSVNETENERTDVTAFRSFVDPNSNRDFNRRYSNSGSNISQRFSAGLPPLKRLLFGNKRLAGIDFRITNQLNVMNSSNNRQVADLNTATDNYVANDYLSNNLRTNLVEEIPSLALTKSLYKGLSNRFYRNITFSLAAKQKFTHQDNRSDKSFQNIKRNYSNFVEASINYNKSQYGEYSNYITLSIRRDTRIPDIGQLAPLIDSADLYSVQMGNINLKESRTNDISLNFNHSDQSGKNTLNYNISAFYNFTDNAFADSTIIDDQNRRTIYQTNVDGYKSASINANVRKALKLKTSSFQFSVGGSASLTKNPGYVNSVMGFSNNLNTFANLNINYSYKGKLALEATENYSFYRSKQDAFNTSYSGTNTGTMFSGSYNVTKKFTLNSNIRFNSNKPSGAKSIDYNIWNASAIYRFLKGSNAEFKFTALDLLRQNSSITNIAGTNSFTLASRNVLQQYFMTTFSYYPRQFGKNGVRNK